MNKSQLIHALADKANVSKSIAEKVLISLASITSDELNSGQDIVLPGIGKLSTSERAARTGRNPKTGESLEIPASTTVKFKVATALKEAVA